MERFTYKALTTAPNLSAAFRTSALIRGTADGDAESETVFLTPGKQSSGLTHGSAAEARQAQWRLFVYTS